VGEWFLNVFFVGAKIFIILHEYPLDFKVYLEGRVYFELRAERRSIRSDLFSLKPARIIFILLCTFFDTRFGIRFWFSAAVIKALRPTAVITFIDNSVLFQKLDRRLHDCFTFIAVQNGSRGELLSRENTRNIFHSHLITFNKLQSHLYFLAGATVQRFESLGSFRLNHYLSVTPKALECPIDYDLCIVSNFKPNPDYIREYKEFTIFACEVAVKKGWRIIVSLRSSSNNLVDGEVDFFSAIRALSPLKIKLLLASRGTGSSSYCAALGSRIVLGLNTSVLKEMLPYRRILSVNPTNDKRYDFPITGPLSLCGESYRNDFSIRLNWLVTMSDDDYTELTREHYSDLFPEYSHAEGLRRLVAILN